MKTPADILRGVRQARYQSLLSTVEWRTFTQRMKEAKGGRCEVCGAEHGLQTHHNFYEQDRLPWEYEVNEVRVLCAACHAEFEAALQAFRTYVASQLTPAQFRVLNGVMAVGMKELGCGAWMGALVDTVMRHGSSRHGGG